jgi:glutamate dehydrogenase
MAGLGEPHQTEIVDRVIEVAGQRLGAEALSSVAPFIRQYFARVLPDDIRDETANNLFGLAFAHWRLASRRAAGTACLRVYNPQLETHGWSSLHTVIEVVTDDMPFLVDSIIAELSRRELTPYLVIHPVLRVRRDGAGALQSVVATGGDATGAIAESFMHFEITRQLPPDLPGIAAAIEAVLADVRIAVTDWQAIRTRVQIAIANLETAQAWVPALETTEVRAFLEWIYDNNFTFLGYREYAFPEHGTKRTVTILEGSGLGLLRDPSFPVFDDLLTGGGIPPAIDAFLARPELMIVTKANRKATVHRPVHLDTIIVKRSDSGRATAGLAVFVGLFSAQAYNRSVRSVPLLRRKLNTLIERAGLDPLSHDGRALVNIVETFPRDELFQISDEHLLKTAYGILRLLQRPRVALFVRRDDFGRFMACLVYIPRDRYTTERRLVIQEILEKAFSGQVTAHYSQVGDAPMARLYIIVKTQPGQIADYDPEQLEAVIAESVHAWSDHLHAALAKAYGESEASRLFRAYAEAFPRSYQERFSADQAVVDIQHIERTLTSGGLGTLLYRPFVDDESQFRFKIFHPDRPVVLSDVLPMLEHLGLRVNDEEPHAVRVSKEQVRKVMIHDFGLQTRSGVAVDLAAIRDSFQETFLSVWRGDVESDRFNRLVLESGLTCREIVVLRAYCKYLRQAGIAFSQAYMEDALAANPGLVRLIVALFSTLFDPALQPAGDETREHRAEQIRSELTQGLDQVASAEDDRILRRFINAIDSTLRTNFYQTDADGRPKPYLAIKLDSHRLEELPLPRPLVEVFIYSPRMEGIHLRGGKVARGGIRWSDRREDFRTEVLGLMKAQMVKNAVIVPVGAKGGFVVKRPPDPADREAYQAEGIECYKTLIRGLLDVTDNLSGVDVISPPLVVRRDGDDPYLVVAADKGTATFSDIANGLSVDYGFWLGDAFASGGSQGYDHKKMGITARGAWESVKRHFREMGIDVQSQEVTVIGVGDMSGDVFGNGMLMSPHIKLLAAFNHQHIFIDPNPDPQASFGERRRLFNLPRSTWADYDPTLISKGGGVFERRAKWIVLTPEMKTLTGILAERLTPSELIRALLKAEVDLLFFGGIGTYVKSSHETHADTGDRGNDSLRVNGADLRCKVVGEGANLGLTQLGRIEYALGGGRLNTDFIDNSAGVDCSDHEVNIKILLDAVVASGDMTIKQRNELLVEMTEEVAELVLRDNYLQTQAISLIEAEGVEALDVQMRLMRFLERQGRLDRAVEFLPDDETLTERAAARQGLTRPEIAVLFSYFKVWLKDEVARSDLPDDQHLAQDIVNYFPSALRQRFRDAVHGHRLRRELVSTSLTNSLINRVGGRFVTDIAEKSGRSPIDVARAYIITRDVFGLREIWGAIEALDNVVAAALQVELHREVRRLVERGTLWFLANGGTPLDIRQNVSAFDVPVAGLSDHTDALLPSEVDSKIAFRIARYEKEGVPERLARRIAYLIVMPSALDIVRIGTSCDVTNDEVARLYFAVGEFLGFGWLRYQAEKAQATTFWQKLAVAALIEELYAHQRDITKSAIDFNGKVADGALAAWSDSRRQAVDRTRSLLAELEAAGTVDLSMLTVASRQLRSLIEH